MDLEDYFYRPILLRFLPAVLGTFTLVMDRLVDGIVVILRKTVYKDSPRLTEPDEGNEVTNGIGTMMNELQNLLNRTAWKQAPREEDYVHRAAMNFAAFKENIGFIGRSLSYGLLLFCLGLCAVLVYLLVSAVL